MMLRLFAKSNHGRGSFGKESGSVALRLFANVGIVALVFAVCWGPVILATVAWLGTYNTSNLFL